MEKMINVVVTNVMVTEECVVVNDMLLSISNHTNCNNENSVVDIDRSDDNVINSGRRKGGRFDEGDL